jgi:hypothetical protein
MTDLYGFPTVDLEQVRALIEPIIGVQMDAHESSYRCGDYYLKTLPEGTQFTLQKNQDRVREEWAYEEYKDMGVLLFVSIGQPDEELRERLLRIDGIRHLQRTTLVPGGKLSVTEFHRRSEPTE